MKTSIVPTPAKQSWVLIDATDQSLGRLATRVATILRGKHRPSFSPHQLAGDYVIVVNATKLKFHPTKLHRKTYNKHSGYLGHMSTTTLKDKFAKDPASVIELAVKGMLPPNRLRLEMLRRLYIFEGVEHPHAAQKPVSLPTA